MESLFTNLLIMAVDQIQNFIDIMNSLLFIIILSIFLGFLGTFADYAKRTGVSIRSRIKFLISSIAYTVISILFLILIVYVITGYIIPYPLKVLSFLINQGIISVIIIIVSSIFLIIITGAIVIYLINNTDVNFSKAFLLSSKLFFSPLIDIQMAITTYVTSILIFPFLYVLSFYLSGNQTTSTNIFFGILGILIAFAIFKVGPSKVVAGIFLFLFGTLIVSLIIGIVYYIIVYLSLFKLLQIFGQFFLELLIILGVSLIIAIFIYIFLGQIVLLVTALIASSRSVSAMGIALIAIIILHFLFIGSLDTITYVFKISLPYFFEQTISAIKSVIYSLWFMGLLIGIILIVTGRKKEADRWEKLAIAVAFIIVSFLYAFIPKFFTPELGNISILGLTTLNLSSEISMLLFSHFL